MSPHSPTNTTPNDVQNTRVNDVGPPDVAADSASSSRPSSSTAAPTANSTVTTTSTTVDGSSRSRPPATTAITTCTANADDAPSQTGRLRYRVPRTRDAIRLLSGSSAGKMTT